MILTVALSTLVTVHNFTSHVREFGVSFLFLTFCLCRFVTQTIIHTKNVGDDWLVVLLWRQLYFKTCHDFMCSQVSSLMSQHAKQKTENRKLENWKHKTQERKKVLTNGSIDYMDGIHTLLLCQYYLNDHIWNNSHSHSHSHSIAPTTQQDVVQYKLTCWPEHSGQHQWAMRETRQKQIRKHKKEEKNTEATKLR